MVHRGSFQLFSLLSLLLLASLVQLSASLGNECTKKRDATFQEALDAFESLYPLRSTKMSRREVIEKLEIFEPHFSRSEFSPLHDYPLLGKLSCFEPSAELCVNADELDELYKTHRFLKDQSNVLYELLDDILREKQRPLCEKEWGRTVEEYKASRPKDWSLILDLSHFYREIMDDRRPRRPMRSTIIMTDLVKSKLAKDECKSDKVTEEAEKLLAEVESACQDFESNIRPIFSTAAGFDSRLGIDLNSRQTKRPEWWLYGRACFFAISKVDTEEAINRVVESNCELWAKAAERFEQNHAQEWLLISEWNGYFRELPSGTRVERGERAMERLLEKGLPENREQEAPYKVSKRDITHAMQYACSNFVIDLWHMLERAPEVKDSQPDARKLLDYKEVCGDFVTDEGRPIPKRRGFSS